MALACHGYEGTRIVDIVELACVSRPTFYEHFESKERCFQAAYEDVVERLSSAVEAAFGGEGGWAIRLSTGLGAGLDFLAASPTLAHLLLVESLPTSRPARLQHERTLARLGQVLRRRPGAPPGGTAVSKETAQLLAGGLASHLSGRVLAGEAERLSESYELLLEYLLTPSLPAAPGGAGERHVARA